MFRIESNLELLAPEVLANHQPAITIRGYEGGVAAPSELIHSPLVSVSDVVAPCPVHRDVYLRKKEGQKTNSSDNWHRTAGTFIQDFLEAVYKAHQQTKSAGALGASAGALVKEARRIYDEFAKKSSNAKRIRKLDKLADADHGLPSSVLAQLLVNSASLDLFALQGALDHPRSPGGTARICVAALQTGRKYVPRKSTRISPDSAPDLVLPKFGAIGDVKSGATKDEYRLTVAGYALVHESVECEDVNVGVLYWVETRHEAIGASRPEFFWITDDLRRRFLDRRNELLVALAKPSAPPALSKAEDRQKHCDRCSYNHICHPKGAN